ncbi:MAG: apolipoprotein N-acyltransferase [Burkholderiaceae bacterium]
MARGPGRPRSRGPRRRPRARPAPRPATAPAARTVVARGCVVAAATGAAWGAGEMLRGWVFTGFPWLSIGYAHIDGPLAGFAPWLGVYGIGIVAAACATLAASAFFAAIGAARAAGPARAGRGAVGRGGGEDGGEDGGRRGSGRAGIRAAATLATLAALPFAAGTLLERVPMTVPQGTPVRVRLAQGNVAQHTKFDRAHALHAMDDYARLVEDSRARLTVLPETAWIVPWSATPPELAQRLLRALEHGGGALALGMPLAQPPDGGPARYANTVALLDARSAARTGDAQVLARYDKRHLVPFGEFVPPGFGWFVRLMEIPLGDFGRGAADQPPFVVDGQRFAFDVCYEDLFGEEIAAQVRAPVSASVLVNASNLAWYGESDAQPQHLAIARMRALETGRPVIRATNTGVTASIDHRGRVLAQLPQWRQGALDVDVQGTAGLTPYARFGNAPALALALVLALAAGLAARAAHARTR